jgi:hypothetical protein
MTIRPCFLSVYTSAVPLPGKLQHSIQGGGLGLTLAGFPPASHQNIAKSIPADAVLDGVSTIETNVR